MNLHDVDDSNERIFRSLVREAVGRVAKAEYSDALIDRQIDRAVREFSRYVPRMAQATLELEEGRDIYSAKNDLDPSGMTVLMIVTDSLSSPPTSINDSLQSLFQVDQPAVTMATDVWLDRYEAEILNRDAEEALELNGDQIIVCRAGTGSAIVRLWVGIPQDPTNFPDRYQEELLLITKAYVAEELVALRAKYKSFSAGGSKVAINQSDFTRMIKEWKDEWRSRMGSFALSRTR